ncbi:CoA transferase [Microbacterium sp.]|uniref:CoA transferase n=1 Tax=Microbacterium sp. TaxID=51671 RepID=UPI003564923D
MRQPPICSPAAALLDRVRTEIGVDWGDDDIAASPPHPVPLPARLSVSDLAWASVRAAGLAAGIATPPDPDRIAMAYRSDRVLTVDGASPDVWSPFSGFWRSRDGWVRTHGNYPHHAARLLAGLDLSTESDAADVAAVIAGSTTSETVAAITATGGLAVPVRPESPPTDARLRAAPLLEVIRAGGGDAAPPAARGQDHGSRPLDGIRVLDLTRVIAGPVCTRTLALLGADVLRVDPPHLAEPDWQHLDTGHGKRSILLDARIGRFQELLDRAEVVVLGYRPSSLATLGLSPEALAARHPGLVIAQLSAWGADEPGRTGFDSLVQAESGIALIESPDGDRPGTLPAQALDHSAGYLLAAAITGVLRRRRREGGTWIIRTSLRRIAAELLGIPRASEPEPEQTMDLPAHTASFDVDGTTLITAAPALPGLAFAAPHRWGSDQPEW